MPSSRPAAARAAARASADAGRKAAGAAGPAAAPASAKPMRADARRNYERLLAEAEGVFAERGTAASLEDVARRAGVAIGTLYKHFPTRAALVDALIRDRLDGLVARAGELLDAPEPAAALAEWVRAMVAHTRIYRGLAETILHGAQDERSELYLSCRTVTGAGAGLLHRAQEAGRARDDATPADLLALISAVAWAGEHVPADQAERLLAISLDGLLRGQGV